jgi:hypothetical protein
VGGFVVNVVPGKITDNGTIDMQVGDLALRVLFQGQASFDVACAMRAVVDGTLNFGVICPDGTTTTKTLDTGDHSVQFVHSADGPDPVVLGPSIPFTVSQSGTTSVDVDATTLQVGLVSAISINGQPPTQQFELRNAAGTESFAVGVQPDAGGSFFAMVPTAGGATDWRLLLLP